MIITAKHILKRSKWGNVANAFYSQTTEVVEPKLSDHWKVMHDTGS